MPNGGLLMSSCLLHDGGLVVAGSTNDNIYLAKLNNAGQFLWEFTFGD